MYVPTGSDTKVRLHITISEDVLMVREPFFDQIYGVAADEPCFYPGPGFIKESESPLCRIIVQAQLRYFGLFLNSPRFFVPSSKFLPRLSVGQFDYCLFCGGPIALILWFRGAMHLDNVVW